MVACKYIQASVLGFQPEQNFHRISITILGSYNMVDASHWTLLP